MILIEYSYIFSLRYHILFFSFSFLFEHLSLSDKNKLFLTNTHFYDVIIKLLGERLVENATRKNRNSNVSYTQQL